MRPKINVTIQHYLLLLVIVTAGYWWLFIYAAQYDLLDCWLPWRHFISKSFHNGIFPLWNPYQQLGYPIYADLQGPALSYENFITGNLLTVNLTALQVILFGYIYLAAIGMYELGRYLYANRNSALVIASAYVCGGIFIYHTQHFFSIVSFACTPLTFVLILRLLQLPKWKYILALVVLFHIQFTTGNQTFNILNFHFICFLVIRKLWELKKLNTRSEFKTLIQRIGILIILTIIAILPVLISFTQTSAEIARYEGISFEKSLVNSMTFPAAISFINPLISSQPYAFLGTDQGMSNYFFGIILLSSSLLYFFTTKSTQKWILLATLVFLFMISLGEATPVYKLFYTIDPLLRLFRFPAYYMYYVYLILLITAGYYITQVLHEKRKLLSLQLTLTFIAILLFVCVGYYGFNKGHILYDLKNNNAFNAFKSISIDQTYTVSFAHCILITIGIWFVSFAKKRFSFFILTFIVSESLLSSSLMNLQLATGETTAAIDTFISDAPKQFYLNSNNPVSNDTLIKKVPLGIWRNYQGYFNQISPDFFNSFYTKKINRFDSTSLLLSQTYRQPVFTASDTITLQKIQFEPCNIAFKSTARNHTVISLKQLSSPFWKIYIDNVNTPQQDNALLRFVIPKGNHAIQLKYENNLIQWLYWLSILVVVSSLVVFSYLHFNKIIFVFIAGTIIILTTASIFLFMAGKNQPKIILDKIEIHG